jgi:hypothetical protein
MLVALRDGREVARVVRPQDLDAIRIVLSVPAGFIATDEEQRGWLLCGYGPHRRLTGASSDIAEQVPSHGRAARLMTLFHEKAALTSAERWLIELDHAAQKER